MLNFLEHKIPPPLVGLLIALGMKWGAGFTHRFPFQGHQWLALILVILGIALALAGVLAFRRHQTTVNPLQPQQASALVSSGIYRYTRNPMYLGFAFALIGWSSYLAAPLTLCGPILFAVFITRCQIMPEERVLQQKFGAEFRQYCQRVRRWI